MQTRRHGSAKTRTQKSTNARKFLVKKLFNFKFTKECLSCSGRSSGRYHNFAVACQFFLAWSTSNAFLILKAVNNYFLKKLQQKKRFVPRKANKVRGFSIQNLNRLVFAFFPLSWKKKALNLQKFFLFSFFRTGSKEKSFLENWVKFVPPSTYSISFVGKYEGKNDEWICSDFSLQTCFHNKLFLR